MTFSIQDQLKMSVSISKFEDFLTIDKFSSFTLIEDVGLSLPYWELKFICVFPEMLKYFNELQTILVQLGTSTDNLVPYSFIIKKPIVLPESTSSYSVTLRGFISMQEYLTNEIKNVYENTTSYGLMQAFSKKYGLKFISNISDTKDKMTYYQAGETDFKFLFTAWLHSFNEENDLIVPAITSNNCLKYNSLKTQIINADYNNLTTFIDYKPSGKEIQVNANTGTTSNTTISNLFGNYMKDRYIYDVDSGEFIHVNINNVKPIISSSKTNSTASGISKSSGFYLQSSNVHKNYYKQELINIQKYMSLQSSKQWISAKDVLVQSVYPGDLVLFMPKKANNQVNDQTSGLYLVNRRVISVKERTVHTNFLLSRENMNDSK